MRKHNLSAATSLVLLAALIGSLSACSKTPSDDVIAKDIETKVAADPDTKDSDVSVVAKDGKVTVTGKVKTPVAQKKVEQIAKEEPGATGLDDQTTVEPAAATPAPVQAAAPPPPVAKPKPQPTVIPAGTVLTVKVTQALGSKTSQTGQTFTGTLAQPVKGIPSGSSVSGTVLNAKSKGKVKGEGELSITLTSISVKGQSYSIQTTPIDSTVKGKGKRTAGMTAGGAAGGALIGGLAGGGKGAAIGAGVGAGAGLLGGTMTGNKQIEIPAESALSFTLSAPLTIPPPAE
jgi:hypothetical protein